MRELSYLGDVRVEHIDTSDNPADVLTKDLLVGPFSKHRATVLNAPLEVGGADA